MRKRKPRMLCCGLGWEPQDRNSSTCLVGIEACHSSHFWGRELLRVGHNVRLIPTQYVKPFLVGGKNDANDAAAICAAVRRADLRFVPVKTAEQQSLQSLHRMRERLIHERTAKSNQIRSMSKIVSSLMQRKVRTIDMDDTIADIEGMFARERLSWAPVTIRDGEVVGVISAADVLQFHGIKIEVRSVGRKNGVTPRDRGQAPEEFLLDLQVLEHRLDDEIDGCQSRPIDSGCQMRLPLRRLRNLQLSALHATGVVLLDAIAPSRQRRLVCFQQHDIEAAIERGNSDTGPHGLQSAGRPAD